MQHAIAITTESDTQRVAQTLAQSIGGAQPTVIHLEGDLGAGKTTFSRYMLQALGHTGAVKSPTYTLVEPYEINDWVIYHFDLYRLSDPEELEFMGIRDYLSHAHLLLIEWPSRGHGCLPAPNLHIALQHGEAVSARHLVMTAHDAHGQRMLSTFTG